MYRCIKADRDNGCFPLQPYRKVTLRISLFLEYSTRTNDFKAMRYATFRYDRAEVENSLKYAVELISKKVKIFIKAFKSHIRIINAIANISLAAPIYNYKSAASCLKYLK